MNFPSCSFLKVISPTPEYLLSDNKYDYYKVGNSILVVFGDDHWAAFYVDIKILPALSKIYNRLSLV